MSITRLFTFTRTISRTIIAMLALALVACSAGPPPAQIAEARIAIQEAERARANELATREYDEAVRHLSVAESTWDERHDAATAAHWARRAEASAREAQYQAEAKTAEEQIRRETERRNRAEIAVRDAEISRLHSEARTEAEQRAAEAEAQAREERERREMAAERARTEAELRREAEERARDAEQTQRETEAQVAEERIRREEEQRRTEEALRAEEARRDEETRRAEEAARAAEAARTAEIERLREEQERTREELRATLSRLGEVRQEARGLVLTLPGSVYFEVNKSVVQPAMRSRLVEITRALSRAGDDASILIEGHTDADGSNEYNLELSRLRAEAVRSVLVSGGVSPARVETQGYGETRPIAPNSSATGKAQNRRVEIVLQGSAAAPAR
ncbi:MAG TPA: OmpA family protein [Thermoanaerobaculia bacterium]|nr:OmpA family protein [Thermoanaerobaculia bacterium]